MKLSTSSESGNFQDYSHPETTIRFWFLIDNHL